jgi:Arc/MetJ family transcription regulator
MRTTLDLPGELIDEARRILGFKSKTDTVVLSLKELIRRHRLEELKALAGKVELDLDIDASRRRPKSRTRTAGKRRAQR